VLVVLDPAVAPVVPERVGQVDVGAALLEDVGRPVPAIGGFEDHLAFGPGGCDGLSELEGLAQDLLDAEGLGHPMDRRAATMHVDPTYCPIEASSSFEVFFARPSMLGSHKGRRPRPFIASGR